MNEAAADVRVRVGPDVSNLLAWIHDALTVEMIRLEETSYEPVRPAMPWPIRFAALARSLGEVGAELYRNAEGVDRSRLRAALVTLAAVAAQWSMTLRLDETVRDV